MSKGSLFFGNARGKLGQVVLSTVKGQQIARAWQPKVANPRTSIQQVQRAKFANSVKFYRRATQNLFKFAFEDKKRTESDYNAFMRHNVDAAMVVNRMQYDYILYPALAYEWTISAGSLGEVRSMYYNSVSSTDAISLLSPLKGSELAYTFKPATTENNVTVGQISEYFVHDFGAIEGDYVTFVGIDTDLTGIDGVPSASPKWSITQIVINTSSNAPFLITVNKQTPTRLHFEINEDVGNIVWRAADGKVALFGVVISRVTPNGVLVSTSNLAMNESGNEVWQQSLQKSYREQALISWSRSSDPILKGAIVNKSKV